MPKIHLLDEQTINQIAAGEVIENPASVVKELVENAIDAGSSEIHIEIRGGGRQLIRITDNGSGMGAEDAKLCLQRHATSKMRLAEDLAGVATMGFRGEAIPSIASISKFQLLTSEGGVGTLLRVEGGDLLEATEAPRERGTTIEVKSLFYNVPVRRKFQRSPAYDTNEIQKVVGLQALAHPEVKFQLISESHTLLATQGENRIQDVLGSEFLRGTAPLEWEEEGVSLKGVVGQPAFTRQNRTGQYLFVNKRPVVIPFISYAVRDGYGTALATSRHPVFVLYATLPGELVDINVHPQKREVRMREQQRLREVVVRAVRRALEGEKIEYTPIEPAFPMECREPEAELFAPLPLPKPRPVFQERPLFVEEPVKRPTQRVIAAIRGYFLIEGEELTLIDQRRAHQRVIFEKLAKGREKLKIQQLLVPYTLKLSPTDASIVREQQEALNGMGISIRECGPNSFIVDALPEVFGSLDIERLIHDLIHRIREFHDADHLEKQLEKQIALAASRAAVSANKKLLLGEAQSLYDRLMEAENSAFCPFGKPIQLTLNAEEIAECFDAR